MFDMVMQIAATPYIPGHKHGTACFVQNTWNRLCDWVWGYLGYKFGELAYLGYRIWDLGYLVHRFWDLGYMG